MEYEEKLDLILTELSKVNDQSISCKELIIKTKIPQNELDRLMMFLAKRDYIIYYPSVEGIIHESGRSLLRDGGFVELKKKENSTLSYSKWAIILSVIAIIISIISLCNDLLNE